MKDIAAPHNFTPREYQLPLFQAMDGFVRPDGTPIEGSKKTRALLRWHRRAGKDKACFAYLAKAMLERVGAYYYCFPEYAQGRRALWENTDKDGYRIIEHFPKHLIKGRVNNQEMKFEATNGSVFRVVGTDKIDSLRGSNPVGVIMSEYAYHNPLAWEVLSPILALNGGWAIFNSTPQGRNHMYHLEQAIRKNNSSKWFVSALQCLHPDEENYNPYDAEINQAAIQEERDSGKSEQYIEQEYGVSYAAGIKGAFYIDQIEKAKAEGRIGNYPADNHRWVDTFWDLGKSDSTAVWFRQIDGGRIVWIDYYEDNNKDIAAYVQMLAEKGYKYRTHHLPHDAEQSRLGMQVTTAEIFRHCLREAGLSDDVLVPHNAQGNIIRPRIMDGINAVRARFSKYYFDEGLCAEGLEKLGNYHRRFDAKRDTFLNEPVHDKNSHCADALRMEGVVEEIASDIEDFSSVNAINPRDYDIFS